MAKKTKNLKYYESVGRRKQAVARVRLYIGGKDKSINLKGIKIKIGEIYINNKHIDTLFPLEHEKVRYSQPLKLTNNLGRFAISAIITGGGKVGQLEAFIHGLARALELVDRDTMRPILKKHGLLTRDSRKKERRKVGTGGKARRAKQSPKR